jgi:hypothetical protein
VWFSFCREFAIIQIEEGPDMRRVMMVLALVLLAGCQSVSEPKAAPFPESPEAKKYDVILYFLSEKYPETADHIRDAIASGESAVCTIDRDGADERREESLEGVPTRKGKDRDEWPMAMCREGGKGSDVRYISPRDNRGAGSWVGNQLEKYPDGTRVKFVEK